MSEEAAVEEVEVESAEQPVEEQVAEQAPVEESKRGHISKEDWVDQGKDPAEWRSPELFEERGKWIKETQSLKQEIANNKADQAQQIKSLNQLHQIQLTQQISDLEARRNTAIDEADTTVANQLQGQIDQIRPAQQAAELQATTPVAAAPAKDPAVAAWEANNAWVNNPADPKTPYANQQFTLYQSQGMPMDQALAAVDRDLSTAFPQVNHNRQAAPMASEGSKPGGKRNPSPAMPTMSDLTREEAAAWDMPGAWTSEKDFLKAVQNSRAGA